MNAFIHIRKKPKWSVKLSATWVARCSICRAQWSYYDFGATLGSVLEHLRREHRDV